MMGEGVQNMYTLALPSQNLAHSLKRGRVHNRTLTGRIWSSPYMKKMRKSEMARTWRNNTTIFKRQVAAS
jgi:hypothetical protein